MESSDIILSLTIIIIFILLYISFNVLGIIARIKRLWPIYRCNPIIMPFTKLFGYDPTTNFNNCVQNIQTTYMGELLKPVNKDINNLKNTGNEINTSITDTYKFIDRFRDDVSLIIKNVMGHFINISSDMDKSTIETKNVLNQLTSSLTALSHINEQGTKLTQSAKNVAKEQTQIRVDAADRQQAAAQQSSNNNARRQQLQERQQQQQSNMGGFFQNLF